MTYATKSYYYLPLTTPASLRTNSAYNSQLLVDTSVLEKRRKKRKKTKNINLKKEKEGSFKNVGLIAAQYNDIAACAYSLKIFTLQYMHYCTLLYGL